jgi:hypothetical protein
LFSIPLGRPARFGSLIDAFGKVVSMPALEINGAAVALNCNDTVEMSSTFSDVHCNNTSFD